MVGQIYPTELQLNKANSFDTEAPFLMGKRELVALLNLSSWCLVMVERLFLAVPQCSAVCDCGIS